MKKSFVYSLLAASVLAMAFTFINSDWSIQPDYVIKFSATGANGVFKKLNGAINFDPNNLATSKMDVSVDVNSISTDNNKKDKDAKNDSWFDAAKYPTIKITSSHFTKTNSGYSAIGLLDMHGVKKEVTIPFTFQENGSTGLFIGEFVVNRKDYGINGPMFGFVVSKEITVSLKVPVKK